MAYKHTYIIGRFYVTLGSGMDLLYLTMMLGLKSGAHTKKAEARRVGQQKD